MKKCSISALAALLLMCGIYRATAQDMDATQIRHSEKYGNTLNLGIGLGYYGYVGHPIPAFHADYDIDLARDFTLAPFLNFYTFQDYNYWGDVNNQYRNYSYRQTVVPIGVKGSYYFDRLLGVNKKWDFYLATSLGVTIRYTNWENGYNGKTAVNQGPGMLYMEMHIGGEYHINKKVGALLDLSTNVSTIGLGFHFN